MAQKIDLAEDGYDGSYCTQTVIKRNILCYRIISSFCFASRIDMVSLLFHCSLHISTVKIQAQKYQQKILTRRIIAFR